MDVEEMRDVSRVERGDVDDDGGGDERLGTGSVGRVRDVGNG